MTGDTPVDGPAGSLSEHSHDVAVVGDGPAGSALARALHDRGVDVVLIGSDQPWHATYTTWIDDLDGVTVGSVALDDVARDDAAGEGIWLHRFAAVEATFDTSITIERGYGVLDNDRLRRVLRTDVRHRVATLATAENADARLVVDSTGWPSGLDPSDRATLGDGRAPVAWQTAFGVVLAEPPDGPLGKPTVMDFGPASRTGDARLPDSVTTFVYSFPVADGWLVEETVLAGPPIDADLLAPRLAARLDRSVDDLLDDAVRVERVRIPMGAPIPGTHDTRRPRFGAAAGMIHTATGYSVASSLRAADRVAAAVVTALDGRPNGVTDDELSASVSNAVWPTALRRTRRLHDYGLSVLLEMDSPEIRNFFQTFFELPEEAWASYLRIDTRPDRLAGVMTSMFRRAGWPLRRRLLRGNLRLLLGVLSP